MSKPRDPKPEHLAMAVDVIQSSSIFQAETDVDRQRALVQEIGDEGARVASERHADIDANHMLDDRPWFVRATEIAIDRLSERARLTEPVVRDGKRGSG